MVIIYSIEPYTPKQYRGGTYGPNARGRHGAHRLSTPCDTAMTERERLEASERRVDTSPAGASPMSRTWQDAGGSGHDITKREAERVTGRCVVIRMLSPTQNSHPKDAEHRNDENPSFTATKIACMFTFHEVITLFPNKKLQ